MLRKMKGKNEEHVTVGLDVQADGIAIAVARRSNKSKYLQCHFAPFLGGGSVAVEISKYIEKKGLTGKPAVFVLSSNEYSLLQNSFPKMTLDEMRDAARWKIKEFIDYPAEEAVVDVFEVPEAGQRGNERLLNVVAARKSFVKDHVDEMRKAELEPKAIDISELALRNVVSKLGENDVGIIVLHLTEHSGLLTVIKQSEVYLSRSLEVGFNDLLLGEEQIFEDIVLELQRSLDYFESRYGQVLPTKLLIFPPDKLSGELVMYINSHLRLDVEPLILEKLPGYVVEADEESQTRCLLAVGAALREEIKA